MSVLHKRIATILALMMGLTGWAVTADAREGFYLGAGFVGVQATHGGFDGQASDVDTVGNKYLFSSIGSGSGISLDIGYNFTNYFGLEYFSTSTRHTGTYAGQPDSTTTIGLGLLGVRLIAPVAKSFELFLRLGESVSIVDMDQAGLVGGIKPTPVEYTGVGSGYGAGFEILGDHFGIGFGYTLHTLTFDKAKINGQPSFTLTKHVNENFAATDVTFAYHFK